MKKKTKRRTKPVWMVGSEIPQNTLFMMSEPVKFFLQNWPKLGLGDKVKIYFSLFVKDFCQMYYLRSEFDSQAEFLTRKMIKNPLWALRVIDKVEKWSKLFMEKSRRILKSPLKQMSDKQLVRLYEGCLKYHRLQHGIGASVSWHADAEKERVTRAIWQAVASSLQKISSNLELADIFSILTTPREESFMAKEERDFLQIAISINKKPKVKKLFRQKKLEGLAEILKEIDKELYRRIKNHHQKYCWLTYQYKGPAISLTEYLGRWQEIFRGKVSPLKIYKEMIQNRRKILDKQQRLVRKLKFPLYHRRLITLAQRLVFIKAFRKEALYHGMYCYEPLFREIGRRLGLTINQIYAMNAWEIPEALLKGKFNVDELNARQKFAVAYTDRKRYIVYTGQRAKNFLKKITFEKVQPKKVKELQGTPACPGKIMGTVKVINIPSEMKKMNKGDVMVAFNTNPNLIPAMKKASALISEAGGLTCHAAIVSRELRTPCIVGVAGAAKVLKDGDKVEVDATKGIVKKL